MIKSTKTLLFSILALLAVTLPLITSYDAREWAGDTFFPSAVRNAPASPPSFSRPFFTNPTLRFIAVGDVGTGGRGQKQVADAMARVAASDSTSFVILLGDNFYERGVQSVTDPQWVEKFESVYHHPSLQIPFFSTLGNHDYYGNPQAQVDRTTMSDRWNMPSRFYAKSFWVDDSTEAVFFFLDTYPMSGKRERDRDSAQYLPQLRWLESELAESKARWKVVAGHNTIYSNGGHGNNPGLGRLLEPLFTRYGVDVYLAGHDHDLQLLEPVNGVHYIVSGAGGKDRSVDWGRNTVFAATRLGFTRLTITHSQIAAEFFDRDGVLQYARTLVALRQVSASVP